MASPPKKLRRDSDKFRDYPELPPDWRALVDNAIASYKKTQDKLSQIPEKMCANVSRNNKQKLLISKNKNRKRNSDEKYVYDEIRRPPSENLDIDPIDLRIGSKKNLLNRWDDSDDLLYDSNHAGSSYLTHAEVHKPPDNLVENEVECVTIDDDEIVMDYPWKREIDQSDQQNLERNLNNLLPTKAVKNVEDEIQTFEEFSKQQKAGRESSNAPYTMSTADGSHSSPSIKPSKPSRLSESGSIINELRIPESLTITRVDKSSTESQETGKLSENDALLEALKNYPSLTVTPLVKSHKKSESLINVNNEVNNQPGTSESSKNNVQNPISLPKIRKIEVVKKPVSPIKLSTNQPVQVLSTQPKEIPTVNYPPNQTFEPQPGPSRVSKKSTSPLKKISTANNAPTYPLNTQPGSSKLSTHVPTTNGQLRDLPGPSNAAYKSLSTSLLNKIHPSNKPLIDVYNKQSGPLESPKNKRIKNKNQTGTSFKNQTNQPSISKTSSKVTSTDSKSSKPNLSAFEVIKLLREATTACGRKYTINRAPKDIPVDDWMEHVYKMFWGFVAGEFYKGADYIIIKYRSPIKLRATSYYLKRHNDQNTLEVVTCMKDFLRYVPTDDDSRKCFFEIEVKFSQSYTCSASEHKRLISLP
uniref:Uncharacterized protein n=1 Tax=Bracon brevicornis TaxID=1563983 RepID=A0A6V7JG31_9HYME